MNILLSHRIVAEHYAQGHVFIGDLFIEERFSIECRKTKTKVIKTANQNKV